MVTHKKFCKIKYVVFKIKILTVLLLCRSFEKMICKVCTGQEEKFKLMPSANLTYINVSTNFKMSSLSNHATTDGHTHAIRKQENEKGIAIGLTIAPCKVVQETPTYSAIGAGFKRMG